LSRNWQHKHEYERKPPPPHKLDSGQQHAVGDQARLVEAAISEIEAKNDALKARITAMTSRGALQRRLDEGYLRLEPIRDTAIARVTPPLPAEPDGVLRTASRDPDGRFGAGAPLRAVSR
jgi:hypothetical protein